MDRPAAAKAAASSSLEAIMRLHSSLLFTSERVQLGHGQLLAGKWGPLIDINGKRQCNCPISRKQAVPLFILDLTARENEDPEMKQWNEMSGSKKTGAAAARQIKELLESQFW